MSEQDNTDDDDWFEHGLREARQSEDGETNSDASDDDAIATGADEEDTNDSAESTADSWAETAVSEAETESESDADSWMETDETETTDTDSDSPWADSADPTEAFGAEADTDDSDGPFDSADADPFGEESTSPSTELDTQRGSSSWADSASEDSESLFDDEGFAGAFEAAGSGGEEFSDEDFESDIPRIDLGIDGLDRMIQGGIPRRHLMVAIGSAGTGKTTFGLQFLHHGLQQGEKGVFITLEQSHESIIATGNEWGWDFADYEDKDMLAIVDLDPVEMANSLDNIQAELPQLIQNFGADRLVLDSVSLLEMMYDNVAKRRTEVFDFTRSLKKAGVTTFLTSEASETNPYASRHGIIEYLTDAVFVLRYIRGDMQETRLAVEIQKIRNANHSRETKPYELTDEGILVYQQANIF